MTELSDEQRQMVRIQEMNRWPFTEVGYCLRCGEMYKLTQLRLPSAEALLNQRAGK